MCDEVDPSVMNEMKNADQPRWSKGWCEAGRLASVQCEAGLKSETSLLKVVSVDPRPYSSFSWSEIPGAPASGRVLYLPPHRSQSSRASPGLPLQICRLLGRELQRSNSACPSFSNFWLRVSNSPLLSWFSPGHIVRHILFSGRLGHVLCNVQCFLVCCQADRAGSAALRQCPVVSQLGRQACQYGGRASFRSTQVSGSDSWFLLRTMTLLITSPPKNTIDNHKMSKGKNTTCHLFNVTYGADT